ncbi:uncharacterized protein PAN0_015c5064 [Moesziomyces antarcticus]|uniref:Uncharacterized protein n=1 Tax=Pseudozyma antarctica TaxID=84753 RepID=A0A081CJJ4_PSEA2|nr:uncharacterized protein PAN0_015c5064 [Moesziomyces antarcticus]GAK66840.1 hypothetical protein PAN0_015c5064 [Moesziomyces antarcticus]
MCGSRRRYDPHGSGDGVFAGDRDESENRRRSAYSKITGWPTIEARQRKRATLRRQQQQQQQQQQARFKLIPVLPSAGTCVDAADLPTPRRGLRGCTPSLDPPLSIALSIKTGAPTPLAASVANVSITSLARQSSAQAEIVQHEVTAAWMGRPGPKGIVEMPSFGVQPSF